MPNRLSRFLSAGLFNTLLGFGVIVLGLQIGLNDYAANVIGYATGAGVAYLIHRRWTFGAKVPANRQEFSRFIVAVLLSYSANLVVVYFLASAGVSSNPVVHLIAIAVYAILLYLLLERFVFAERDKSADVLTGWGELWPNLLLMTVAVVSVVFLSDLRLSHDIHWQFWIARQMIGGTRLYADIWEVNPPLWFWTAVPVEWIAAKFGIDWKLLLLSWVAVLGAFGALIVAQLVKLQTPLERAILMVSQFWITTIVPLSDIGQREQLALLVSIPYAALIAKRRCREDVSPSLALLVVLLGAYGFALKHYFVVIPLAFEVWLIATLRRDWKPIRTETLSLGLLAILYGLAVFSLTPEFFSTMLPMIQLAYDGYKSIPLALLLNVPAFFWILVVLFLISQRQSMLRFRSDIERGFFSALMIVTIGFFAAYVVQQKGWHYQSFPVSAALSLGLAFILIVSRPWPKLLSPSLGLIILFMFASTSMTPRPENRPVVKRSELALRGVSEGEPVFIAAVWPRLAWPTVDLNGQLWTSRFFAYWMIPSILKAEATKQNDRDVNLLAEQILTATFEDISCNPPRRIVIDRQPILNLNGKDIDLRDFLFRSAEIRKFIAKNYKPRSGTTEFYSYEKGTEIKPIAGPGCRKIF